MSSSKVRQSKETWEWPKNHRRKNGGGETILGVCIKGPLEAKLWLFRVIAWEFCLSLYSSADKTNDFSMAICLYPHSFLRARVTRPSALNLEDFRLYVTCSRCQMARPDFKTRDRRRGRAASPHHSRSSSTNHLSSFVFWHGPTFDSMHFGPFFKLTVSF